MNSQQWHRRSHGRCKCVTDELTQTIIVVYKENRQKSIATKLTLNSTLHIVDPRGTKNKYIAAVVKPQVRCCCCRVVGVAEIVPRPVTLSAVAFVPPLKLDWTLRLDAGLDAEIGRWTLDMSSSYFVSL